MPDIVGVALFPIGHRGNELDRQDFPIASELTTTAGRFFLISAPIVGSKLTSQTSPRFAVAGLIVNYVSTTNFSGFRILLIICFKFAGLLCH